MYLTLSSTTATTPATNSPLASFSLSFTSPIISYLLKPLLLIIIIQTAQHTVSATETGAILTFAGSRMRRASWKSPLSIPLPKPGEMVESSLLDTIESLNEEVDDEDDEDDDDDNYDDNNNNNEDLSYNKVNASSKHHPHHHHQPIVVINKLAAGHHCQLINHNYHHHYNKDAQQEIIDRNKINYDSNYDSNSSYNHQLNEHLNNGQYQQCEDNLQCKTFPLSTELSFLQNGTVFGVCSKVDCNIDCHLKNISINCPNDSLPIKRTMENNGQRCCVHTCICNMNQCRENREKCTRGYHKLQQAKGVPGQCCDLIECKHVIHKKCTDTDMDITRQYDNGESWLRLEDCHRCKCIDGVSKCEENNNCPIDCLPSNSSITLKPYQCCLPCKDCRHNGNKYRHLDTWLDVDCKICVCINNKYVCDYEFNGPKYCDRPCTNNERRVWQKDRCCDSCECNLNCPNGFKIDINYNNNDNDNDNDAKHNRFLCECLNEINNNNDNNSEIIGKLFTSKLPLNINLDEINNNFSNNSIDHHRYPHLSPAMITPTNTHFTGEEESQNLIVWAAMIILITLALMIVLFCCCKIRLRNRRRPMEPIVDQNEKKPLNEKENVEIQAQAMPYQDHVNIKTCYSDV